MSPLWTWERNAYILGIYLCGKANGIISQYRVRIRPVLFKLLVVEKRLLPAEMRIGLQMRGKYLYIPDRANPPPGRRLGVVGVMSPPLPKSMLTTCAARH